MKLIIAALFSLLFAQSAFANAYVKCGEGKIAEFGIVEFSKVVVEFSSEGDDFNGRVGGTWSIKFNEEEWLEKGNIFAKSKDINDEVVVEVTVVIGKDHAGPVGTRYILTDLYGDYPKLEKFTMGGFIGNGKAGEFLCESGHD